MTILLQVLSTGVGLAGYYALIAVGFALIFGTLRIFHVAHGTVFMIAGYTFFSLHRLLGMNVFASAVVGVLCAVVAGLAIDKIVYGPVLRRGGGMFAVFIASLGAALIVEAGFLAWSKGIVSVARTDMLDIFIVGGVAFRAFDFVIFAFVAAAFGALYLWLHRTSTGLEVRGLTDNADLAAVVGVNVRRTRNAIFLIASALAGLAGVLVAYDTGLEPSIGFKMLFIGVVAVILGGVRNILLGTIVGATCLGAADGFRRVPVSRVEQFHDIPDHDRPHHRPAARHSGVTWSIFSTSAHSSRSGRIVALAANLVIGYTGMMSMGQAAYLGVGAYATATLNILLGVNFYLALLIGSITAAIVGAITLLPLLRIGGFYFALATLGVNFVFFDIFHNLAPRVEGSEGLYGLQLPDLLASSAPALCHHGCGRHRLRAVVPRRRDIAARARTAGDARSAGRPRGAREGSSPLSTAHLDFRGRPHRTCRRPLRGNAVLHRSDAVHARRFDPRVGLYRSRRPGEHHWFGAGRDPAHRVQ